MVVNLSLTLCSQMREYLLHLKRSALEVQLADLIPTDLNEHAVTFVGAQGTVLLGGVRHVDWYP